MTKQTVYQNNFARKRGFRLQFLTHSAFLTHHCWRGLMTFPISPMSPKAHSVAMLYQLMIRDRQHFRKHCCRWKNHS